MSKKLNVCADKFYFKTNLICEESEISNRQREKIKEFHTNWLNYNFTHCTVLLAGIFNDWLQASCGVSMLALKELRRLYSALWMGLYSNLLRRLIVTYRSIIWCG